MSTINNGGPAFPVPLNPGESWKEMGPCDGMTLRDYFAAKVMQAMWSNEKVMLNLSERGPANHLARMAYEQADAMLKAREEA